MKLQLRHKFTTEETTRLSAEQIKEITKRQMITELAKHMMETVKVNEEEKFGEKEMSAEVIYIPYEQFDIVLGKLRDVKLLNDASFETKRLLKETVDILING